ncbi:LppM family (lipo)protein [Demequina zhanjiangensis]|uniref:LppM domain-containing protein n=1 Tax=Demequina zhanjiangensis TaxID=3051659 RepID=A0ABT8FZQ3_9MICO|nr:hypothetical protein [Demequina sp. SYSU T00b26]MDN4472293.1 hypothetical protein [Demequina sp. SYSU T00b26]
MITHRSVSRPHRLPRLAAAAVSVLALAGCIRLDSSTEISGDDTFSQQLIVAFAPDIADQLGGGLAAGLGGSAGPLPDQGGSDDGLPGGMMLNEFDPSDLYDQIAGTEEFQALEDEYPDQVALEPYDDGELVGVEVTLTDLPLDLYAEAAETAGAAFGLGGGITHEDGRFVVTIPADEARDPSALGLNAGNLTLLANAVDVSVAFTFPGLVTEAPPGTAEGRTVTLGIAELMTPDEIRIVASDADQIYWTPILTWGGIILAALVIVGGATFLVIQDVRARRRSHLPTPDATHERRIGTLGPEEPEVAPESPPDEEQPPRI